MRKVLLTIVFGGLLAPAGCERPPQVDFPLKYVEAKDDDPLTQPKWAASEVLKGRPPEIKALPKGLSETEVKYYFVPHHPIPIWSKRVLAALDPASSPPKLYVDVARTGDLAAVKPLIGNLEEGALESVFSSAAKRKWRFNPIALPVGNGREFNVTLSVGGDFRHMCCTPAGYMMGEVKLAGETYRIALFDGDQDGLYYDARENRYSDSMPLPGWDTLAIDLDHDGKFTENAPEIEVMPLAKIVRIKDSYYLVQAVPDGTSIHVQKCGELDVPRMGALSIGTAHDTVVTMLLRSELLADRPVIWHNVSSSAGKWEVPEGRYWTDKVTLSKTDAQGARWVLGPSSRSQLDKFEIRPGETLALKIGPPLILTVRRRAEGSGQLRFSLCFEGKGGESYPLRLRKGTTLLPPPKVKILDASRKVLAECDAERGSEGLWCYYLWRVPEGFTADYCVKVEANTGPFEVKEADLEHWFRVE
jgi:hypothetical protein